MYSVREISPQIYWVGGSDRRLERFENIFPLPDGITYNSYLILDEKTALLDTVDTSVSAQFCENIEHLLDGRGLDYLVVSHVEPDHCADIEKMCQKYPELKIIGNAKTFQLISQFFSFDFTNFFMEVKELDELVLGSRTLRFYMAPMVHWPEVMFAYETTGNILFSADAFGTFGAFSGGIFNDEVDFEADFLPEARRYYSNIVGKFGAQVQAALNKVPRKKLAMICPLHGPVWRNNVDWFWEKYNRWSRYLPEAKGVVVAYASMYGNTESAVVHLAGLLAQAGVENIHMYDVSKTHPSYIISQIFQYSHLVLASPTYNMGLYLPMHILMHDMAALNVQNRKVVVVGNGSWAPTAPAIMKKNLEEMKDMKLLAEPFVIKSAMKEKQAKELQQLADAISASVHAQENDVE